MDNFNLWAVTLSTIYSFILGFLWYTLLFEKQWAYYLGITIQNHKTSLKLKSFAIFLSFSFITSYIFGLGLNIWRSFILEPTTFHAIFYSFVIWLGFFLPFQVGRVSWEKKSWGLVFLNGSYDLLRSIGMGLIFYFLS